MFERRHTLIQCQDFASAANDNLTARLVRNDLEQAAAFRGTQPKRCRKECTESLPYSVADIVADAFLVQLLETGREGRHDKGFHTLEILARPFLPVARANGSASLPSGGPGSGGV